MTARRQSCIKFIMKGYVDYDPGLPDEDFRSYKQAEKSLQDFRADVKDDIAFGSEFEAHVSSRRVAVDSDGGGDDGN